MRTTSFPAAVAAVMMADNTITDHGVLPPERSIPPQPFIAALRERGLNIEVKQI
jgi:saccharopine dehydrogenase-like NADP-dependent oxidoreductase